MQPRGSVIAMKPDTGHGPMAPRGQASSAPPQLLARMPHHDRGMPGGHGPANDPDAQGLVAQPVGQGRYTVQPVDLAMSGPWLFEIHVHEGAETRKAYFAASVGEE
jgi:hypothetical protein